MTKEILLRIRAFWLPRGGNVADMLQIHYRNYFTKMKAFTQIEI